MYHLRLTNGIDVIVIAVMSGTDYGEDWKGHGYRCCKTASCDHSHVPAGMQAWHDNEHTELLWRLLWSAALQKARGEQS